MSRVGKMPITIPADLTIEQRDGKVIVKGQKGVLEERIHPEMTVVIKDNEVRVERPSEDRFHRSLHGLTRSLIQNMIMGLSEGNVKKLEIIGVGYRAELKGKAVVFQLGFSHPIYLVPPEGIEIEIPTPTSVVVKGIDKQLVGQIAAKIRSFRPPEPYKGKGVRYVGEYVRRKAGKANV
ncbi:50S ribosomal protein L6 [bacterium]|nr:50S ribosomal protein L6 [bacterium]